MRFRNAMFAAVFLLCGTSAFAQEEVQRIELFGEYSYFRFNPTIPQFRNRSFNGGGGGATFNINHYFGIKAEFMGYGSTTWGGTFSAPVVTPRGTVPAGTYNTQGNMFTYLFGPVVKIPVSARVTPFGEILFGGSNSNGYANLTKAIDAAGGTLTASNSGTQHPFTMGVGGGLDVHINHNFSIRPVELDYVLTRYTNPFTNTNNQNHFRYTAGAVFRF
jgi:Outer membrane protein beta-barrel domain